MPFQSLVFCCTYYMQFLYVFQIYVCWSNTFKKRNVNGYRQESVTGTISTQRLMCFRSAVSGGLPHTCSYFTVIGTAQVLGGHETQTCSLFYSAQDEYADWMTKLNKCGHIGLWSVALCFSLTSCSALCLNLSLSAFCFHQKTSAFAHQALG